MSGPDRRVNWTLLGDLDTKTHPLVNHDPERFPAHAALDSWTRELIVMARTAHHLLDLAGIPNKHGGRQPDVSDLDARTYLLLAEALRLRERLSRIGGWHARESGPGGTVGDYCTECGEVWPCDTRRMADGTYVDDDVAELLEGSDDE